MAKLVNAAVCKTAMRRFDPGLRLQARAHARISMVEWCIKKGLFRNVNHAIWFINSFSLFIFAILVYKNLFGRYIFLIPIVLHLSPIINAIRVVYVKKEKSEIYSYDCIWFNSLMLLCYIVLTFTF